MKGLELLTFLTKEQIKLIETSELNYRRFARVYFQINSFENNEIVVKIWQTEDEDIDEYLSAKDLISRAKDVFNMIPEDIKIHFRPIPFKSDDLTKFSTEKILKEMDAMGLQPKDLVKLLCIDKSTISQILSSDRNLSRPSKAMFYYMFKYLKTKVNV
jgi:hypothetical protein